MDNQGNEPKFGESNELQSNNDVNRSRTAETIQKSPDKSSRNEVLEWVFIILISLAIVFVLRTFVMTTSLVVGESMLPTLNNNDYLIIRKIAYTPKRSDIVIFRKSGDTKTLVKRVIAISGDKIDIDLQNHKVILNDKVLDEPYIDGAPTYLYQKSTSLGDPTKFPVNVPENKVIVFGDNRLNSVDSRFAIVGLVDRSEIIGKVSLRLWPMDKMGKVA